MGKYQNHTYPFEHLNFFSEKSMEFIKKKFKLKIERIEYFGLDLTDYLLFKEYLDNKKYVEKLNKFINYMQSILDKNRLSNSMRVIFKNR